MLEFIDELFNLYNIVSEDIHKYYKKTAIEKFKEQFNINGSISEFYYSSYVIGNRSKGVVYTPTDIANYIVYETLKEEDIIKNPYLKVVDPACGGGNILFIAFKRIKEVLLKNGGLLKKYKIQDIDAHILNNNIFGFDVDKNSINALKIDIFEEYEVLIGANLRSGDFLFYNDDKFDYIIGNPPYVGIKAIDKSYAKILKQEYKSIYKDKGDLSYCFFQKGINSLEECGKLTFITSRYFLESQSGEELRKTLKDYCKIIRIFDFYGVRPFKNVGIDPVIIFIENTSENSKDNYDIEVLKPKVVKKNISYLENIKDQEIVSSFLVNSNWLNNKRWILRSREERDIINKIENKSFCSLNNISTSYQGIITGCDKSFVISREEAEKLNIETELLRPWIKSSNVLKNEVKDSDKYLIYSDMIIDIDKYPEAKKYIKVHKERLSNRRETKNGKRPWFHLQWGREEDIFKQKKIIYPYKSTSNRFALDKGNFFSADVYSLILEEDKPFSYDYILKLLNSDVYEFYFKSFAKKLGENLYEYYPNNLMKLCIPTEFTINSNEDIYKFFGLTNKEIHIIKRNISQ